MPQIQVIGREAIEDKNNLANQAAERQKIIQDAWYKAQMLRYYADELKVRVQTSQDEIKKAEMTQKYNEAKLGADVMDNAYKIAEKMGGKAAQDYLMGVQQQSPQLFPGIMETGFGEKLSKLQPSGSERLAGSAAKLVEQQLGGGQQLPGAAPVQNGEDTGVISRVNAAIGTAGTMGGGAETTNQGRAGAVGGALIPQISVGGVNLAFPEAQARLERSNVIARKTAERDVEMEPIRNSVNYYIDTFDRAVAEMGGLSSTQIDAMGRGSINTVWANIGNKPNTLALQQMAQSVALQLGSYLNKGRPTEQDAAAAAKMLVKLTLTEGANEILRNYLQIVVSGKDMYVGRDRRGEVHSISPAADKIYDMLRTGNVPKEEFIIVEIKK